jgi:sucrose phosphorylase
MTNVTSKECQLEISLPEIDTSESQWYDLMGKKAFLAENQKLRITLQPYDVIWLQPSSELE